MLVSIDVFLFTNVPQKETIRIIAENIYRFQEKPNLKEKTTFILLMEIARNGIFMYQGKYYQQTNFVTMGSPLQPTVANFCLAHFGREATGELRMIALPSILAT